jgi:hypothetical protein
VRAPSRELGPTILRPGRCLVAPNCVTGTYWGRVRRARAQAPLIRDWHLLGTYLELLDTRLAIECEVEALRARGRLEAEKARLLAEIERLREESKEPQDYGSPTLNYYESEALRDRLDAFEAKYRAFGGTLPDAEK